LNESKVVGTKPVIARRHQTTLFEPPVWEFESRESGQTRRFWLGPSSALAAEADINMPTVPDESVENDQSRLPGWILW